MWGSPWQPRFGDWAFGLDRGPAIRERWDLIPDGLDVLITHGPPAHIGDRLLSGEHVGCEDLRQVVRQRRPRLHVFGHIHEGYGVVREGGITYVNASVCDAAYRAVNRPVVISL